MQSVSGREAAQKQNHKLVKLFYQWLGRKLSFQKVKEGRKGRLSLGDLRSECRTQQIRETGQRSWCPEDRWPVHHTGSACERAGGIPGMTREPSQRRGSESAQLRQRSHESWGTTHSDTKEQGSIQVFCATTDFLPSVRRPDYSSTVGHITMNITFLKRSWLNKLGNTECFICLNM